MSHVLWAVFLYPQLVEASVGVAMAARRSRVNGLA
jgi:hypothetical protein